MNQSEVERMLNFEKLNRDSTAILKRLLRFEEDSLLQR